MLKLWQPKCVVLVAFVASIKTVEPISNFKVTVATAHLDLDHVQGSVTARGSTLNVIQAKDDPPFQAKDKDTASQGRVRISELLTPLALTLGMRPVESPGENATLEGGEGAAALSNDTSLFSCARIDPCVLGITKMVWAFLLTGFSMFVMFIAMVLTLGFAKTREPRKEQPPEVLRATTEFPMPAAGEELLAKASKGIDDKSMDRRYTTGDLGGY